FAHGQSVAVSATASDSDGSIAKVDFMVNGVVFATDTTSPYTTTWTANEIGSVSIFARATDNLGGTKDSGATITVNPPQVPPTVFMHTALNGMVIPAGHVVQISAAATASQYSSGISKV